jgi:Zn-finger domain-containing protein
VNTKPDNHFQYLLTVYNTVNGGIIHRFSAKTMDEVQKMAVQLKGTGDMIIQKVEHWVVL